MSVTRSKKGKSTLSKLIAWLHLWPGIISGVIVVFVCLTGTSIVFFDEILNAINKQALHVVPGEKRKSLEELIATVRNKWPDRVVSYVIAYKEPDRSVKALTFSRVEEHAPLTMVYLNPYSGQIIKTDATYDWFYILAHLHNSLLLEETGAWIVDIATIIFVLQLITGLVLWWPKNKSAAKQRFWFRWKKTTQWKRKNYDLHNILGFYTLVMGIMLGITGLIMAFSPVKKAVASVFGGANVEAFEQRLDNMKNTVTVFPLDSVANRYFAKEQVREVQFLTYNIDSSAFYLLTAACNVRLLSHNDGKLYFIDKASGKEMKAPEEHDIYEKVDNINMQLHMGNWLTPAGKILSFIAGLVCTSLPVTGFYIWWGRRNKEKRATRKV